MAKIQNKTAYKAAIIRMKELLPLINDDTSLADKNLTELDLSSDFVEEYEDEHYPIKTPSLVDMIKLRMYEMGINQAKLSELLGVSPSRITAIFYLVETFLYYFVLRLNLVTFAYTLNEWVLKKN